MTHEELDDLFRANSERGEFAPAPGEWDAMTRLLEADERRARYGRYVSAAWGLLFLGLIGFGVYGAVTYAPTVERAPLAAAVADAGSSAAAPGPDACVGEPAHPNTGQDLRQRVPPPPPRRSVTAAAPGAPGVGESPTRTSALGNIGDGRGTRPSSSPGVATVPTREPAPDPTSSGGVEVASASAATLVGRSNGGFTNGEFPSRLPPRPLHEVAPTPTTYACKLYHPVDRVVEPRIYRTVHLSALGAAEATGVSADADVSFGYRAGLRASTRLSRRLSLSAAVAVGRRNYHAGLGDTGMPAELFADHVRPHSTVGAATVLEVPFGVDYHPESAGPLVWFLSASVNSYHYLSEEMVFEYPEHRPGQVHEMRDPRPGGTLAASLRLGGGIWIPTGLGRPLRVSPYVELPLRAQAYSEVSLYSAGLQVDLPLLSIYRRR